MLDNRFSAMKEAIRDDNSTLFYSLFDPVASSIEKGIVYGILYCCAKYSRIDIIGHILEKREYDSDVIVRMATITVEYDNRDVISLILKLEYARPSNITYAAAEHGRREILYDVLKRDCVDFSYIAYYAAKGGHKELMLKMIGKAKVVYYDQIAEEGHREL